VAGHTDEQYRFTVYSKHGVANVCMEGCTSSTYDGDRECLTKARVVDSDPGVNIEDNATAEEAGEEVYFE
jgi:hypothetical protein